MNLNGIKPNVGTLNAVLEALSGMFTHRNSKEYALATISEFRQLGIEPSLASYYYLIKIFCRDRKLPIYIFTVIYKSVINTLLLESIGSDLYNCLFLFTFRIQPTVRMVFILSVML